MKRATSLILILLLSLAGSVFAQEAADPAPSAEAGTATTDEAAATTAATDAGDVRQLSSYEIRNMFTSRLKEEPRELATLLVLDPALLSNAEFMAAYPRVAAFLDEHPQVRRNPKFYLAEYEHRITPVNPFEDVLEGLTIFGVFALIAFVLAWLVRTIIEQKRWNRLTRTQTEVHNKILDRFGTSSELLEYVRSPAGTKFLESAPIPLYAERTPQNPSATRVMWSIQLGVIIAAGAVGLLLVSLRFTGETAHGFFAMGAIGFCIGAGFIASAFVSIFFSRRLGIWGSQQGAPTMPFDDTEPVR